MNKKRTVCVICKEKNKASDICQDCGRCRDCQEDWQACAIGECEGMQETMADFAYSGQR